MSFPTSAQSAIKLHQRKRLLSLSTGKVQLCGKEVGVIGEDFQIATSAVVVTDARKQHRSSRSGDLLLLRNPVLLRFLARDQGIGDIAEGGGIAC